VIFVRNSKYFDGILLDSSWLAKASFDPTRLTT